MAIYDRKLVGAYKDTCNNYKPDKHKEVGVVSMKTGILYECKNYDYGGDPNQGCYWCKNKDYKI
jgi:hypothetical protein